MSAALVAGASTGEGGEELVGHVHAILAHEWVLPGPQAPQQDAERVDIGALSHLRAGQGGVAVAGGGKGEEAVAVEGVDVGALISHLRGRVGWGGSSSVRHLHQRHGDERASGATA